MILELFKLPSKINQCYTAAPDCDPNMDKIIFWPMSMHKELNSLCITLVAFFDPKHFLVEKSVPRANFSSKANRQ